MAVKSLEELRKIREQNEARVSLRSGEDYKGDQIQILVGLGTCGIAVGARETLNTITQELEDRKIGGVRVVPVGCVGYCRMEPIVMVNVPGVKSCAYGKVTKDKVPEIISGHILGKKPVESMLIDVDIGNEL